jgi:HlyD family secretion protein
MQIKNLQFGLLVVGVAGLATAGCSKSPLTTPDHVSLTPAVKIARPEMRTIRAIVAQPGVIEAYEQTPMYSKVAGFVQKWNVDIGSRVKKDELLAEILVPELNEELKQKEAEVEQLTVMIDQAQRLVTVAESNLQTASDAVEESKANLRRYQADVERWDSELARLTKMVRDQVVNPEILEETRKQAKASEAAQEAAAAAIKTKESEAVSAAAQVEKTKADRRAAEVRVTVAKADQRRVAALVGYTRITAPYDGVITARNISTGDFVRPASGDSSARDGGESGGNHATPLFVIARTDPVMFVMGVPEVEAPYVVPGTKAAVRMQALGGRELKAEVTRTSLALNNHSRTLQAQIDLPNKNNELLPGMYAYGSIVIERENALALPVSSVVEIGNRMCCFMVVNGKAVRTPIQTGISDGSWIQVMKKNTDANSTGDWVDLASSDQVIVGDLSEISNGKQVAVDDRSSTTPQTMLK